MGNLMSAHLALVASVSTYWGAWLPRWPLTNVSRHTLGSAAIDHRGVETALRPYVCVTQFPMPR